MADKCVVDKIVTNFLLNTTRLCSWLSENAVLAATLCSTVETSHPQDDTDKDIILIPLITGSMAEFYIEPMLPHVGDIDIMGHPNNVLAIPHGHSPPTWLPAEFHNYVKVFEIIDSHWPGYVYLAIRYLLTKCTDIDRYNVIEYGERSVFMAFDKRSGCTAELHGPAKIHHNVGSLSIDLVLCVRCLQWPCTTSHDWPSRYRNYGWPDSATVDQVVNNGCDVVQIAHHLCSQAGCMRECQWRLSFSRAEIVLLNSWMPVQQIAYHLLRVFMKTGQLRESASNSGVGTLSNYHIKTLMLWACELKPKSWWVKDVSFIRICAELLHTLAIWLTEERCLHYFVSSCNLVDKVFDLHVIADRLLLIDKDWLSLWFIANYTRKCARMCPDIVSKLFDDVCTITECAFSDC